METERLLIQGTSAEGRLDEEKVMILNHKEGIRYLVDNARRLTINTETIYTIHYLLADSLVEPKYAGKVRDHGVRIGGSTYIPFEDSKRLQIQLERIAQKATLIQDPFEQSLFLLIHISYLQAFSNVNKRTARLLANIPLITQNLVPLSFNDIERDDYMSAMISIYELQDIHPLADLYVYSYLRTCAAYDSTVKSMGFDEVRIRYREERRAIIRQIILQKLTKTKMNQYILTETKKMIPKNNQQDFQEDILEDLELMDSSRLTGLGITLDQLNAWRNHSLQAPNPHCK
ncbi:MAG: Fic family protein [Chlamydiales bacterium]|nr:Fic family protein [Chlamydiales bacterium]